MKDRLETYRRRLAASPAWRQNSLLIGLTVFYFAWVYIVAVLNGYQDTFNPSIYWEVTLKTIIYTAFFMSFVSLLHLVLIKRPALPLTMMWENLKAYFGDLDRMLNVLLAVAAIPVVASLYTSFKTMIPGLVPFYLDQTFMEIDRAVHFGHDPWRLTHALFGGPGPTVFINLVYHLWFFFLWDAFPFDRVQARRDLLYCRLQVLTQVTNRILYPRLSGLRCTLEGFAQRPVERKEAIGPQVLVTCFEELLCLRIAIAPGQDGSHRLPSNPCELLFE